MNRASLKGWNARNIWHWWAVGLGSGLSPFAPGTAGSLAALLFVPLLVRLSLIQDALWVLAFFILGVIAATRTGKDLGVHDHSAIVIDEWVGQWLALYPLLGRHPLWPGLFTGFALFRFFDILKPWPIRWLDRRVGGGWGVMLDDVLAGMAAAFVLQLAYVYGVL